jgi:dolichol kinase
MGLMIVFLYFSTGMATTTAIVLLASALGLDLMVEMTRLRVPAFNEKVLRYWGPLMRNSEATRMSGVPHYLVACMLAVAIFPKPVAVLSILYLAAGDPVASLFGILYGKHSLKLGEGKSLIGTLAGIGTCMVVTFVFLKILSLPDHIVIPMSLVGGLAGGTAELLPFDLDDNFTIPIISGFILWLAFIVFGI